MGSPCLSVCRTPDPRSADPNDLTGRVHWSPHGSLPPVWWARREGGGGGGRGVSAGVGLYRS